MIKDFAWHFFKKTGNISTFLEYKNIDERNICILDKQSDSRKVGDTFGNIQNKGNSNKSSQL